MGVYLLYLGVHLLYLKSYPQVLILGCIRVFKHFLACVYARASCCCLYIITTTILCNKYISILYWMKKSYFFTIFLAFWRLVNKCYSLVKICYTYFSLSGLVDFNLICYNCFVDLIFIQSFCKLTVYKLCVNYTPKCR